MHSVVLVPVLHVAVDCQRRGLAQCLAAVSVLQLIVWTGAAERRSSAATGFAGLAAAVVSGFAVLPVTAVSGLAERLLNAVTGPFAAVTGFAERPVSAVAFGWHCQRCLPGGSSVQVGRWTDVKLSCGETTWN